MNWIYEKAWRAFAAVSVVALLAVGTLAKADPGNTEAAKCAPVVAGGAACQMGWCWLAWETCYGNVNLNGQCCY